MSNTPSLSSQAKLIIAAVIVALLATAGVVYYRSTHEKQFLHVEKGFDGSARNPYELAVELSEKLGQTVHPLANRKDLPDPEKTLATNDTVMLFTSTRSWPQTRLEQLVDWAQRGGHLIFLVVDTYFEEDNHNETWLLDEFGVEAYKYHDPEFEHPLSEYQPGTDVLAVDFDAEQHLYDYSEAALLSVGDPESSHLLQFRHGSGMVTVLADSAPFYSNQLAEHDHARAWQQLISQHGSSSDVWLLFRTQAPSWLNLLWQYAHMAVIALLVLIALSIWYLGFRFGPRHSRNPHSRRDITEHLAAAGQWHWQEQPERLLLQAQQRVLREARRRHSHWQQLSKAEQLQWLVERSEAKESALAAALEPMGAERKKPDQTAFLSHVKTLNRTLR